MSIQHRSYAFNDRSFNKGGESNASQDTGQGRFRSRRLRWLAVAAAPRSRGRCLPPSAAAATVESAARRSFLRLLRHCGLAASLLLVACLTPPEPVPTTPSELAALMRRLMPRHRPTWARLSLELDHAPCRATTGGVPFALNRHLSGDEVPACGARSDLSPDLNRQLRRAHRASTARLGGDRSPEALHTRALWELLPTPTEVALERAERLLTQALRGSPQDPALLNDLGVVRFELAQRGDARRLVAALDHLHQATVLRPAWPVSRFNVALALSAVPLTEAARTTWASFLASADDRPDWTSEAEQRQARLEVIDLDAAFVDSTRDLPASAAAAERLVAEFPHRASDYLLDELLPSWSAAYLSQQHETATRLLDAASLIARGIEVQQGDAMGAEIIARVREVPFPMARIIAEIEHLLTLDRDRAMSELQELSDDPATEVELLMARIRNQIGNDASNDGDHTLAANLFAEAESALSPDRHPKLLGRILWHRGRSLALQGRDAEALPTYRRAQAIFIRLGDWRRAAAMQLMQSEELEALGRPRQAWNVRLQAIASFAPYPTYFHFHNALLDAAESLTTEGLLHAARLFVDEAIAVGRRAGDAITVAEATEQQVALLIAGGDLEAAQRALSIALEAAAAIDQAPSYRLEITSRLRLVGAQLATRAGRSPEGDDFAPLLAHFQAENQQHKVIETFVARSRRWLAHAEPDRARADLEAALAILIAKNRNLDGVGDRLAHSDVVHRVFAGLVSIHAQRHDALEALVYAECARLAPYLARVHAGWGLAEESSCDALRPIIEEHLGEHRHGDHWRIALTLEDRLLLWTVDHRGLRLSAHPMSRKELEGDVDDALRAVDEDDRDRLRELSRSFWRWLDLSAIDSGSDSRLLMVADGTLGRLPAAALIDPDTGQFLVERCQVSQAVSLLLHTPAESNDSSPPPTGPSLLIADPAFDAEFTDLLPLESARSEVAAIAAYAGRSRTLVGSEATREAIVDSLAEISLLHYAGHAVANAENPFASYLLLAAAGEPPRQQVLRADELLDAAMPRLRLAVLSACETANAGARGASPATGLAGLAMPFLLRGTVDVVATLRGVDDRATAELMRRFHHHRQAGRSTAAALRAAQLGLLSGEDPALRPPGQWAWVVAFD